MEPDRINATLNIDGRIALVSIRLGSPDDAGVAQHDRQITYSNKAGVDRTGDRFDSAFDALRDAIDAVEQEWDCSHGDADPPTPDPEKVLMRTALEAIRDFHFDWSTFGYINEIARLLQVNFALHADLKQAVTALEAAELEIGRLRTESLEAKKSERAAIRIVARAYGDLDRHRNRAQAALDAEGAEGTHVE